MKKLYAIILILFVVWIQPIYEFHGSREGPPMDQENILKGKTIVIDPGHQQVGDLGQEPNAPHSSIMKVRVSYGTVGRVTGVPEYVFTLEIGKKLRQALEEMGALVVMTRDTHEVNLSNIDRAKIGNDADADMVLRIHADGGEDPDLQGISLLFPARKNKYTQGISKKSYDISKSILEKVIQNTDAKNNGLKEREDITGFNWSTVPVTLIECGYMTNEREDILLNSGPYQDKLVKGITEGIVDYFMLGFGE